MADKSDSIGKGGISSALSTSIKRVVTTIDSTRATSSFVQEIDLENNQSRSPIRTR